MMDENKGTTPNIDEIKRGIIEGVKKEVMDGLKDKIITMDEFRKQMELFRAEIGKMQNMTKTDREAMLAKLADVLKQVEKSEGLSGADAGNSSLIPRDVANFIIAELYNNGWIFKDLTVFPGTKGILFYPAGGAVAEWVDVGTSITGSDTKVNPINYSVHRVNVGQYVGKNTLEESPVALANWLLKNWTNVIHDSLVAKMIAGTGTGEPKGLQQYNADIINVTADTGHTTIDAIDYDDLIEVYMALDEQYRDRAMWIVSKTFLKRVRKLKDNDGKPIFDPTAKTIFDRPYREVSNLPTSGTTNPVAYFGYLPDYILFDAKKVEFSIIREDVEAVKRGQVYMQITMFFDGQLGSGSHMAGLFLAAS